MQNDFAEAIGPFRIRDLKNGLFQIHSKRFGAFEGSLDPIVKQAINWGINRDDLTYAFVQLRRGYDFADFGLFGKLILLSCNSKAS